jgi:hypothetical protein
VTDGKYDVFNPGHQADETSSLRILAMRVTTHRPRDRYRTGARQTPGKSKSNRRRRRTSEASLWGPHLTFLSYLRRTLVVPCKRPETLGLEHVQTLRRNGHRHMAGHFLTGRNNIAARGKNQEPDDAATWKSSQGLSKPVSLTPQIEMQVEAITGLLTN